ncbi:MULTISPECIES: GGDEF domain-containing protein [unclassified Acidovorax]|uniref:GGDEF domain-containing protein n=1 Tax=unclassified Acidovorax TaxID=2684926 RepID=UPI0028832D38|nr:MULTISPECIES: GGDEF domain-containing protein [unclassified Acidovorax]
MHLPTLLLATVVASVVMAAGLLVVGNDRRREGLGLWAVALLMQALAYVLLAGRGKLPDAISIVLANTLLAAVFACVLGAAFQFQGRALPWARMLVPMAATAVLFTLFLDDYLARLVLAGIIFPLQLALPLWELCHPGQHRSGRGTWLVATGLLLQAIVLVVRGALAAQGAMPAEGLMQESVAQHLTFLATFVTVQASSFGFVLMAKDRADDANRRLAAQDSLTGVPNRRSTIAALDRSVAQAVRAHEPLALMMVDIDHFKRINDGLGHLGGDEVLCRVVDVLRERLRTQDLVGRYGGEEFLVLLPRTPLAGALELARQLCAAVEHTRFDVGGRTVPVTLSIGVVGGSLEPGDSWDGLIAAADEAMYRAKHAGRNRVEAAAAPHRVPATALA